MVITHILSQIPVEIIQGLKGKKLGIQITKKHAGITHRESYDFCWP